MGKASKRVKRNGQKMAETRKMRQCLPLEAELDTAFIAEDYAKVLEILANLIQAKDIKADLLYKGAYSYFMLGDCERAVQWVDNTLNYDAHNVDARILLARICFMQNRHDDGLALYDFLVSNYSQIMSQEQKEQITDSSEFYVLREADIIREKYPHLADFLKLGQAPEIEQNVEVAVGGVEKQIEEIQKKECSFREKVRLFNTFAAAQYVTEDYVGAKAYLQAALQIDDGDAQTIRNMAMVQAALGDYVTAQAMITKLPEVDFVLLYILKEQAGRK